MLRHDSSEYEGSKGAIETALRQKGIREWYDQADFDWYPEFRALVDSIIENIDSDTAA